MNFLATFVAIAWIDRFGRRPLLFTGLVGMGISLAVVAFSFSALRATPAGSTSFTSGGIVTPVALVVFSRRSCSRWDRSSGR